VKAANELGQGDSDQSNYWSMLKDDCPLLVDTDKQGNAMRKYNCHAYVYWDDDDRWIDDPDQYHRTSSAGCWKATSSGGTAKTSSSHSCLITGPDKGKCGQWQLCLNNSRVYSANMPTQKYSTL
jgi:hypothetical protein